MRLFPVLVAVVAIAVPLSECKNANGQTADSLKQTIKVFIPRINQQSEKDSGTTLGQKNANAPAAIPVFPITPGNTQTNKAPEATEAPVLISEVAVRYQVGQILPELENQVYKVIRTQPGRTTTRSQLQEDINAIFATGFFSNVQVVPEDTPLGVKVM